MKTAMDIIFPQANQSVDNFLENALHHSSCIANYLLNMKSDTVPVEKESEHAGAFQQFIDSLRDDLFAL
jgi:hypothetical protein